MDFYRGPIYRIHAKKSESIHEHYAFSDTLPSTKECFIRVTGSIQHMNAKNRNTNHRFGMTHADMHTEKHNTHYGRKL